MTTKSRRILLLDIIRGIALLGILLVNMRSFHSPDFIETYYGIHPQYQGIDTMIDRFFQLFIQMKFYPIFAFLFGLGFYIFIMKSKSTTIFIKRMICLFIFGLFHLVFLWYGDILHTYAVCGLLLIFFQKLPSRQILYWAVAFLTLYHLLLSASVFIPVHSSIDSEFISHKVSEYTAIYKEAPYIEWIFYRINIEVLPILYQLPIAMMPILGSFLLGLYAGRKKLYIHNNKNIDQIKAWCKWSLMISTPLVLANGLIMSSLITIGQVEQGLTHLLTSVSGISLSIFYLSSLFLLTAHSKIVKLLIPFSYVGQMALTNYLLQTIVSVTFVRFFDLYEKISLVEGTFISLLIFSAQLLSSYFWLVYFQNGPAEWLWRSLTNGKFPLIKRNRKFS
ncbi:MAG: DUF418 domain-containing protein [Bacillota bacterium]